MTNEKRSRLIGACLALLLLSSCGESTVKPGNASGAGGEFVFDPAPFSELQIKGVPADGASSWGALEVPPAPTTDDKALASGRELYTQACAACHGVEGKGDGLLATKTEFNSQPANFTIPLRSIKIRSTLVGSAPAEADLFRTITRGLPGSASGPAFATAVGLLAWAAGEGRTLHDIDLETGESGGMIRRIINFLRDRL